MARRTSAPPPPDEQTPAERPAAEAPTTIATAEPDAASEGAGDDAPTASARAEGGFFAWLRGLGLPRRDGWLGGVCGGIAARIGIDALLVRGIVVVLAVIGAPVALIYAAAWFLLPDEHGTIHAQQLGHGRVTRALPGIVAVFLLSFLPLTQSFWFTGALYWGDLGWSGALGRGVWTGVLIVVAIVVVVWLARRASAEVPTTPATTDDRPDTVPSFPADAAAAASASSIAVVVAPDALAADPGEPPAPPADATAEELAAWKQSQDEWQKQRAAWAAEQRRGERERRQAEAHARAVEAAEAARERARIRKLTRPRASAGIVFLVLGVALVSGAIAAFAASRSATTTGAEWMIGTAVLVLVLGVGTVAVALGRRRSGALAFFSILSVLALALAVVLPTDRTVLPPGANWGVGSDSGRFAQLAGSTSIYVPNRTGSPATVDLWQLAGSVQIQLNEGATVHLEYTTDAPEAWLSVQENLETGGRYANYRVTDGSLRLTAGTGEPDAVIRLWAGRATSVWISTYTTSPVPLELDPLPDEWWESDASGDGTDLLAPTPTPSPVPTTEGATP